LLLLLGPVLVWRYVRRSRGAWQFSERKLLPPAVGWRALLATWGGLASRVLGLTLTIVALSGPRWPDPTRRETEGIAIAMVLDVSVSMGQNADFDWQGAKTTRLLGVKKLFRLFVEGGFAPDGVELKGRPNDLIALVTFASYPETACPLTLEHAALLKIMEAQEHRDTTQAGDGITWGLHVLQTAQPKRKVLVYLSDGEGDKDQKFKPLQAAQLAASLSIPIYTIDASPAQPTEEVDAQALAGARDMMQTLARMTQGKYFRAQDGRGLLKAYESIDAIERERILSFQYRRFHEGYLWFALAALGCWLLVIFMEATFWRRIP
jgi:Ca-activated chloride channel family protein